ncbi:AAA family ATPase [Phaeobacter gallaeciensis]|uniref:AAA family ATPase n=1 Tax=Phaeobacter gallaeciensis TaxID=60890 RepID=UPI00237FEE61|nr:AAA family ATPase [Phaeobacter gallaeciensis]MDE4297181.1 AAA family ATPase [Phaeobacter gallaeciensis]
MLYGVSGASGVGKSTVCELVADALDIAFIKTSITESARKHGYDAVGDLSLPERIDLQEKLLNDHVEMLEQAERPAILDRTPIDMIGYMMGEVYMNSHEKLTREQMFRISSFATKCMWVVKRHYDSIFHLAPLPFYEQSQTRPAENPAYQKHTDFIMRGALAEMQGQISNAILNTTDLNERQEFIHNTIVQRLDHLEALRKSHPNIH